MAFTAEQFRAITTTERAVSVLSMVGSFFIMGTFLRWHYFRKPINRLVFYASFGNVMANIATLISTSALPVANEDPSALCQFQGVLIQWFMMADSLWVFCMALNVMLVFFHQYNSRKLRSLEKWYLLCAYGVPFIPTLIYIVVEKATHKRIFGPATIWCWVDSRVEWMRIAFFYAPIWVVVCLTLAIHIYTGYTIFQRRRSLLYFSEKSMGEPAPAAPVIANPFNAPMTGIERTTEISVRYTTDSVDSQSTVVDPRCHDSRSSFSSSRNLSGTDHETAPHATVNSESFRSQQNDRVRSAHGETLRDDQQDAVPTPHYKAAITAHNKPDTDPTRSSSVTYNPNLRRNASLEGNRAAWSYFKVAFLMFAALFIVWVPSTVNRLQSFISRDHPIFGLNLASALVLPLQGFWNMLVYISTTWPECKRALRETLDAIAAAKHTGSRQAPRVRKDSDYTLAVSENQDFDAVQVPLHDMRNAEAPYRQSHVLAPMPSGDSLIQAANAHMIRQ